MHITNAFSSSPTEQAGDSLHHQYPHSCFLLRICAKRVPMMKHILFSSGFYIMVTDQRLIGESRFDLGFAGNSGWTWDSLVLRVPFFGAATLWVPLRKTTINLTHVFSHSWIGVEHGPQTWRSSPWRLTTTLHASFSLLGKGIPSGYDIV